MRFIKESLLSFFVVGVAVWLYFLAALAALLTIFSFHRGREREIQRRLEIAAALNLRNRNPSIGKLQ